jgi:hypothetical protein
MLPVGVLLGDTVEVRLGVAVKVFCGVNDELAVGDGVAEAVALWLGDGVAEAEAVWLGVAVAVQL